MIINDISLIFLFLIPKALVCTAAIIFLRWIRSAGAIIFLVGVTLSLTEFAAAILLPRCHETWYILIHTGFLYAGTYLYAVGLLMIALKIRNASQPTSPPYSKSASGASSEKVT